MAKISVKSYEPMLTVNVHLQRKEKLLNEECALIQRRRPKGLMSIQSADAKNVVMVAPANLPLSQYLASGISRQEFFDVLIKLVNVLRSVATNKLSLGNLCLEADNIFVNYATKELYFIYCPMSGSGVKGSLGSIMGEIVCKTNFRMPADMVLKQKFTVFVNNPSNVNTQKLEEFIIQNCPEKEKLIDKIGTAAQSAQSFAQQSGGNQSRSASWGTKSGTDMYYNRSDNLTDIAKGDRTYNVYEQQLDRKPKTSQAEYSGFGGEAAGAFAGAAAGAGTVMHNTGTTVMDAVNTVPQHYGTTVMDAVNVNNVPVQPQTNYGASAGVREQPPQHYGTTVMDAVNVNTVPVQPQQSSFGASGSVYTPPQTDYRTVQTAPPQSSGTTVMGYGGFNGGFGHQTNFGTTVMSSGPETVVLNERQTFINPRLRRMKTGEEVSINKPVFRVGKEEGYVDYLISDNPAVSRSHADIITRDGHYYIYDNNSTNKTYVNNIMIPSLRNVEIEEGSHIRMANEDFIFIVNR